MSDKSVGLREKIGYGLGDAASSMFWKLFTMYLLFFYTDVVGINAAIVGTMILITRVWDSLLDPVIGIIADRTESRWGKFRPYLLWVAVPFGVIGVLTFSAPDLSMTGKIVYAYVTYSLMMVIYSLINVPYASLLGVISPDPKTRTELSSYRMIFAFLGSILVLALVEILVDFFSKRGRGDMIDIKFGWQMAVAVFAILAVLFFLGCFAWTKERVKPINEQTNPLKVDVIDLFRNKPWWILLAAGIGTLIFNSIRDGAAVYYFKYCVVDAPSFHFSWLDTNLAMVTVYLVLGQAANIVGILLVTPASSRIGKKYTYLTAMALATVFSILFYFVGFNNIGMILALQVLISICAGAVTPLLWSMYADTADYSEWSTGRRATGLIFSSSSMSQKFGGAIGVSMVGWLLAYFGFMAGQVQTEGTQFGIRLMLSLLPAVATLISVLFISLYPLSEAKMKQITRDLEAKRRE